MPIWLQCAASVVIIIVIFLVFMLLGIREKEMPEDIRRLPLTSGLRADWIEVQARSLPCLVYIILCFVAFYIGAHALYRIITGG